jgi:dTDP-4-dehydrorhamnose reductase
VTILRLATQREELRIVCDQIGAPTWSRQAAISTLEVLSQVLARENSRDWQEISGTYHMTAAGETSWYEFANAILEEAGTQQPPASWLARATQQRPPITRRVVPISTDEYPTPARRPAYSVLSNARLAQVFRVRLPHWRSQLRGVFSEKASGLETPSHL